MGKAITVLLIGKDAHGKLATVEGAGKAVTTSALSPAKHGVTRVAADTWPFNYRHFSRGTWTGSVSDGLSEALLRRFGTM